MAMQAGRRDWTLLFNSLLETVGCPKTIENSKLSWKDHNNIIYPDNFPMGQVGDNLPVKVFSDHSGAITLKSSEKV